VACGEGNRNWQKGACEQQETAQYVQLVQQVWQKLNHAGANPGSSAVKRPTWVNRGKGTRQRCKSGVRDAVVRRRTNTGKPGTKCAESEMAETGVPRETMVERGSALGNRVAAVRETGRLERCRKRNKPASGVVPVSKPG